MKVSIKYIVYSILGILIPSILYTTYNIPSASAHLIGQPPFLKINGQYANLYPVPLTSLYNFDLPQDLAPENYLVNQPINFELDKDRLPAPPDIVSKTKFDWDFTDGSHAQGLKNTHKFTQVGSYIIKIYADDGTTPKPQLLESALVNILPDKSYSLPQAKILINGRMSKDSLTDIINVDFKNVIQLDARQSTPPSLEYFWDFGDQKSASGPSQTHKYPADLAQAFVVLRAKDNNGFLADNFVEIQNLQNGNQLPSTSSGATPPSIKTVPSKKTNQTTIILEGLITLIILIVTARWWLLARRRGKHQ